MNDVAGRRVRGGGGQARRAERTAVHFETARFIERNIPNFEILNEEALQIIEWNADTVLEEIGVNFPETPGALALWREAGATVTGIIPGRLVLDEVTEGADGKPLRAQIVVRDGETGGKRYLGHPDIDAPLGTRPQIIVPAAGGANPSKKPGSIR